MAEEPKRVLRSIAIVALPILAMALLVFALSMLVTSQP